MNRAATTEFLFQGEHTDYFTAMTDQGSVRIGLKGSTCFDIPAGHAYFDRIVEATSGVEIEDLHDELTSAFA